MAISPRLQALLLKAAELGASDLHVHSGSRLRLRINGQLVEKGEAEVSAKAAEALLDGLLTEAEQAHLKSHGQVDLAITVGPGARARCNVFRQQRGLDAIFRLIPGEPPTLGGLNLPPELKSLADYANGLVLVCGPAGSGKTSTIAALVDIVNGECQDHIITIEDPVEVVHPAKRCVVNHRQVGLHTHGFPSALRAALREDPDVIMVGELRDLESISLALTAAETGHLVFSTVHTRTAVDSVNRLINVFPPAEQPQIRAQLADSLRAVVAQRLLLTTDKKRRLPATELLVINHAIRGLILDSKTEYIFSTQELRKDGMCTLDQSLAALVRNGLVTNDEARSHAINADSLAR
jgi:twitching motility protein PilT